MMRMFWAWAAADPDPEKRNGLFDQLMNMYKKLMFPWDAQADKRESVVDMYKRMMEAREAAKKRDA
jgi:hypothetical protein